MENKDYYTSREIILGLRNSYRKAEQELVKLKLFCEADKKVEDFYFFLHQYPLLDHHANLHCNLTRKQNILESVLFQMKKILMGYDASKDFATCTKDFNEKYYLMGFCSQYPISICHSEQNNFKEQVEKIMESEFTQNIMSMERNGITDRNKSGHIFIKHNGIHIYPYPKYYQKISCLNYDSRTDIISISSFDKMNSKETIEDTLNMEFPSRYLNEYHMKTINESQITDKPIILEEIEPTRKSIKLSIHETEKGITLQKVIK